MICMPDRCIKPDAGPIVPHGDGKFVCPPSRPASLTYRAVSCRAFPALIARGQDRSIRFRTVGANISSVPSFGSSYMGPSQRVIGEDGNHAECPLGRFSSLCLPDFQHGIRRGVFVAEEHQARGRADFSKSAKWNDRCMVRRPADRDIRRRPPSSLPLSPSACRSCCRPARYCCRLRDCRATSRS